MNTAIEKVDKDTTISKNNEDKFLTPYTDIYEDEEKIVLKADMPGVAKENLSIHIEEDQMVIIGEVSTDNDGFKILHKEVAPYNYRRAFKLGREMDQENISASLDNGVVEIKLLKMPQAKSRKIEIQ